MLWSRVVGCADPAPRGPPRKRGASVGGLCPARVAGGSGHRGCRAVQGARALRTSGAQDVGPFLRLSRRFDQAEAMITAGPKSTPAMGQMSHETFQALQTKLHKR